MATAAASAAAPRRLLIIHTERALACLPITPAAPASPDARVELWFSVPLYQTRRCVSMVSRSALPEATSALLAAVRAAIAMVCACAARAAAARDSSSSFRMS
jgi:hypothetical protein